MKLYFNFISEPSTTVFFFLKCNGVEFEPHTVDFLKEEHRTQEFQMINPLQRVPVIDDDDGFIFTESVAIMHYVATKFKLADHWFQTKDVKKQARIDEFLNWYHTNLRKNNVAINMARISSRMSVAQYPKVPYDADKIKALQDNLARTVKDIDEYFLKDKPFIAGDEISAADLLGFCELRVQYIFEDDTYKSNENVYAWMKRVSSHVERFSAESQAVLDEWKDLYANAKE